MDWAAKLYLKRLSIFIVSYSIYVNSMEQVFSKNNSVEILAINLQPIIYKQFKNSFIEVVYNYVKKFS